MIGEEAATILLGEDTGETPLISLQSPDIQDVNHEDVAGLSTVDPDRAAQNMHDLEIHLLDVGRIIVITDLAIGPVLAFDAEHIAWIHRDHSRNIGMPAVVPRHLLLIHRLGQVDLEKCFWHRSDCRLCTFHARRGRSGKVYEPIHFCAMPVCHGRRCSRRARGACGD